MKTLKLLTTTTKILKSGKIFSCFFFASSSPDCDMWLSCLSCATTTHPSRFSKSSWYYELKPLQQSYEAIYVICSGVINKISLSDYFKRRQIVENCPIYDILTENPFYLWLDTRDNHTQAQSIVRGLENAATILSTSIPEEGKFPSKKFL